MSLFRFDAAFRNELRTNWPVLLLAFSCLLFGFSAPAFALPFLFSEVIDEFGWTREQATLLASAKYLTGAVAALVVGRCLDMIGVRAALVGALGIGGLALISLFFVDGLAVYYLAGVLLGLAGPGAMVAVQILVSRTFHASQGTAIGVALLGTSLGSVVVPLVITALVAALGWRLAFPALSLGIWFIVMPMLLFFMPKAADTGRVVTPAQVEEAGPQGLGEALRLMKTGQFWLLAGATFLTATVDQGFIQHQVLILNDMNLSRDSAALAVSAIGLVGIVCRILVGNILDGTSNKGLSLLYGTLTFSAIAAFYLVSPIVLMAFVVLRAAGHAAVLVDTTVMTKHVFGLKNFGTMVGIFTAITSVGFAAGPWVMGRLYDLNGNYHVAFILFAVLPVAAAVMTWMLKPAYWHPLRATVTPAPKSGARDLTTLNVTLRTGETRSVTARTGVSVMETIRDSGIDEIMAICGGCCSCATCHVYVADEDWSRLSPASAAEAELLEFSEHPSERSRLSCQIRMSDALDGLSVTIAPED